MQYSIKEVFAPKLFDTLRRYSRAQFGQDALAGVIVGIVAIPLAIAFGISSGVGPTEGLITAIIAGLLISIFGGSKVQIGGPYFFGIANRFDEIMLHVSGKEYPIRIIRMRKVPFVDSTAMHNLATLIERSHKEGITIILSGVKTHVLHQLQTGGIEQMMNPDNICPNIHVALKRAEYLLKNA